MRATIYDTTDVSKKTMTRRLDGLHRGSSGLFVELTFSDFRHIDLDLDLTLLTVQYVMRLRIEKSSSKDIPDGLHVDKRVIEVQR